MPFRVISAEPSSPSGTATSSAIEEVDEALAFALVLNDHDLEVLRIVDAAGIVVRDADEVKAWCAERVGKCRPSAEGQRK